MDDNVLERVRQVGPDKQGAQGSYAVCGIAEAAWAHGPAEHGAAGPAMRRGSVGKAHCQVIRTRRVNRPGFAGGPDR